MQDLHPFTTCPRPRPRTALDYTYRVPSPSRWPTFGVCGRLPASRRAVPGPPVEAAMRSCRILVAVIALLLAPSMAVARGGGGGHGGGGHGGSHSIVTSPVTIPSRPPAGSGQITCSRERSDDVLSTANRRGGLTRIIGGGRVGRRPTHRVGFRLGSRRRTGPWANAR